MQMYTRIFYLEKIKKFLNNTNLIKVIMGQRRVGKSYFMKQIIEHLKNNLKISSQNIIYINFEIDYLKFPKIKDLDNFIQKHIKNTKGRIYLFLDEIQELNGREKLINSYRANENFDIDIFITGSNANLLSSDLSTYLAGRYISFYIYPFSYKEYLDFFGLENNQENFLKYLNTSGISEIYKLPDQETQFYFLQALKETIILKDIVKKYKVKEINLLERLFDFISNNIGNLSSINSIVKKLGSIGVKTNAITIGNYIEYFEKTFSIHSVSRYDLQGKKILEGEKKYYLNDLGFNNFFFSSYDLGKGKHLENIVYLNLKRLGYKVYVGKLNNGEVDFIAEKGKEKLYIQVAYLITDETVFKREFGSLTKINDNYEKIVLSLDPIINDYKGIKHFKIYDWLIRE